MAIKTLHYCWFGGNPLPESAVKYMKSWQKFCPDFAIKRWDETNFDVNSVAFVREAYAAKSMRLFPIMCALMRFIWRADCMSIRTSNLSNR